jgi:hypothetical protein
VGANGIDRDMPLECAPFYSAHQSVILIMKLSDFLHKLNTAPDTVEFSDTMAVIEALYRFTPTAFTNGSLVNHVGQNSGSCKLFAFARLQGFDTAQTLACFGAYYRNDVLLNLAGSDHQNIRNFMRTGWDGISFAAAALAAHVTSV